MEGIRSSQRGSALIVVLWLMMLLAVVVAYYTKEVMAEATLASNYALNQKAYYIAKAGIERAILEISKDDNTMVDCALDTWCDNPEAYDQFPVGQGYYRVQVTDEESKINLNAVDEGVLSRLLYAMGVDREVRDGIVDCIMDWKDDNDAHRLKGAEKDYYLDLEPPYPCKDGPFDSVEELLLVKGVTEDLFRGYDTEEGRVPGLVELMTVDTTSNTINVNTAPGPVLQAALGLGEGAVESILRFREEGGYFQNASELSSFGVNIEGGAKLCTTSRNFSIVSTGVLSSETVQRTVRALISREKGMLELKAWYDTWDSIVPEEESSEDEAEETPDLEAGLN